MTHKTKKRSQAFSSMDNDNRPNSVPMATVNTDSHQENGFNLQMDNNDNITFQNLSYREPVDLQFKDVTYTVNLGFRKGE